MKTRRRVLLFLLFAVLATRVVAQQRIHTIYLPAVIYPPMDGTMGLWSYVEPLTTDNLIGNPSIEAAITGWTANAGGETLTRVSTVSRWGVYSLEVVSIAAVGSGTYFDVNATTAINTEYTFSVWLYGAGTVQIGIFDAVGGVQYGPAITLSTTWTRYTFTATFGAGANRRVLITQPGGGIQTWYCDGMQFEQLSYATTYCDGDQEGCEWNGAAHASTSTRSALSRAGGVVINFEDLSFDIGGMFGAGMSPITVNVDSFAILPGGEVNSIKTDDRPFTLSGWVSGTSLPDLHAKRQAIIDALKPNAVPNNQPVILRYTGAAITKEIAAAYEAGLAGTIRGEFPCLEQNFVLRFLATDPNFYEIGNSAAVLDTEDTFAISNVLAHFRETGQWDALGPPGVPGIAVYAGAEAAVLGLDGTAYYGGPFVNFDNQANADGIVSYDRVAGTYAPLGTGCNAQVNALTRAPNGDIYAGGLFVSAGGVGNTFRVARWDVSAGVWLPLGAGLDGVVNAFTWGQDGLLYIGGAFTDVQGGPTGTYNYIVGWDPIAGTYSALGTGLGSVCLALATDINGDIIATGSFVTAGGNANVRIARWDGAAWGTNRFGAGLNAQGNALAVSETGILYIGGDFTTAGGAAILYIAQWNGTAFSGMGDADNSVYTVKVAPNGLVYAGGAFTVIGGLSTTEAIAIWNGSTWVHIDVNFPAGNVRDVVFGIPDPVVSNNYDVWIAFSGTGITTFSGTVAITNDGTEDAFPVIVISRTGGTSAKIKTVRNETLGLALWFDYDLLDSETLTIDLTPTSKSIGSSFSDSALRAVLANSDMGIWRLRPGTNQVTCFVDVVGAPTIVGTVEYRDPYWAAD